MGKKSAIRIACFGDSLTEGYGLNPEEALPVVLERMLEDEGIAVKCRNFGVSGDTSGDGLGRIAPVLDDAPDAAVVAFGANDCFLDEPVETVEANLSAIIEKLRERNVPVLLVGVNAGLNPDDDYRRRFEAIFPALAKRYGLLLFPDILAPYQDTLALTLMDGMHPNAQGVEAIARALLPRAEALVRQVRG